MPQCFLAEHIAGMIKSFGDKFIKKQHLTNTLAMSSILNFEFEDSKKIMNSKQVVIGFAAQAAMENSNATEQAEKDFKQTCVVLYQRLIKKLQDRSPLKYTFARQLCCLNPQYLVNHPHGSLTKFDGMMLEMIQKKYFKPDHCDNISKQFRCLSNKINLERKEEFKEYNPISGKRIDVLFYELIGEKTNYREL